LKLAVILIFRIRMDRNMTLFVVTHNDHVSVTKQLIETHCNIDVQVENGDTPQIITAHKGHVVVAQLLLPERCIIDLQTKTGETVLQAVQREEHATIAQLVPQNMGQGMQYVPMLGQGLVKNNMSHLSAYNTHNINRLVMGSLLEEDKKEKNAAAASSQERSNKKNAGGQGPESVCNMDPSVCGGMQIWVKTLTVKTVTLESVLQVESSDTIDMVKIMILLSHVQHSVTKILVGLSLLEVWGGWELGC
jgi:hypothetical protein